MGLERLRRMIPNLQHYHKYGDGKDYPEGFLEKVEMVKVVHL
jgi:hypothetical protein